MKKEIRTELAYHCIFSHLSLLLGGYGTIIENDEILKNALQTAVRRVDELLTENVSGDIIEQYVVVVFSDESEQACLPPCMPVEGGCKGQPLS